MYARTQLALVLGSIVDFACTWLLVHSLGIWYVAANVGGNVTGAVTQYTLSRIWVFKATEQAVPAQLSRFVLMWTGNIGLSALFVFILTNYLGVYYMLSKLIVSIILGLTYNYLVSRRFVFRKLDKAVSPVDG